jgi:hypothetical protein
MSAFGGIASNPAGVTGNDLNYNNDLHSPLPKIWLGKRREALR